MKLEEMGKQVLEELKHMPKGALLRKELGPIYLDAKGAQSGQESNKYTTC